VCPHCATAFLAGVASPDPITARLAPRDRGDGWKAFIMIGGSVVVLIAILLVLTVLGTIF
jgi:hypothetical protein